MTGDWMVPLAGSVADGTITPEEAVQICDDIAAEESEGEAEAGNES